MRIFITVVILVHGLIHFLGFLKSVKPQSVKELSQNISKQRGILWLFSAILLTVTAVTYFMMLDWWWILALPAVIISQILIISAWKDARFGTIANIIILTAAIIGYISKSFEDEFRSDVKEALSVAKNYESDIITERDLQHLPAVVQKYLKYSGVLGKERLQNVRIEFEGELRSRKMEWFPFRSKQYNTFDPPTRSFFMYGDMMGTSVPGYHSYKDGKASMLVKLFGLIPVADNKGELMNIAETVTVFNDMCLMAPASLVDKRVTWGSSDSTYADAIFTNNDISISARLLFNEIGQLTDFISDDRFDISGDTPMKFRFSTPVKDYKKIGGSNVMSYGEAVWHYPNGEFVYGKFRLKNIDYNCNHAE